MAKKIYEGISGVARKISKYYDGNVSGVARKIKKAYHGVGGVARTVFEGLYYWERYVSLVTSNTFTDYSVSYVSYELDIYIKGSGSVVNSGDGIISDRVLTCYTGLEYSKTTGKFTFVGETKYQLPSTMSLYVGQIEKDLIGKYVKTSSGIPYKITGHDDVYTLYLRERYSAGRVDGYVYSFEYEGDVSSEDPNAYEDGSTASYTSTSNNDIRTVYIRKN